MILYILRHGIAADVAASDRERPLTPRGREQMGGLSEWMVKHQFIPEVVITSPLVRAAQTAEILSDAAGLEREDLVTSAILSPGADPERLCKLLRENNQRSVAIVSHAPDVQVYTAFFTGGGWLSFGRANIACLEINGPPAQENGMLRWFINPKMLGF